MEKKRNPPNSVVKQKMGIFPARLYILECVYKLFSYAGITRIRFLGMISAHVLRHPFFEIWCKSTANFLNGKMNLEFALYLVFIFMLLVACQTIVTFAQVTIVEHSNDLQCFL